ncbi:hypothetical protein VPHD260_0086 [Vibrio phage D260]
MVYLTNTTISYLVDESWILPPTVRLIKPTPLRGAETFTHVALTYLIHCLERSGIYFNPI